MEAKRCAKWGLAPTRSPEDDFSFQGDHFFFPAERFSHPRGVIFLSPRGGFTHWRMVSRSHGHPEMEQKRCAKWGLAPMRSPEGDFSSTGDHLLKRNGQTNKWNGQTNKRNGQTNKWNGQTNKCRKRGAKLGADQQMEWADQQMQEERRVFISLW